MKAFNVLLAFACLSTLLFSCKKLDETSLESQQRADIFKAFIVDKQFQVKQYYSDQPIDYIDDDAEVRSETDLFRYVSPWIKDDLNAFDINTNVVTIAQGDIKINGNAADTLTRDFSIGFDNLGVYYNFLTYQYSPLQYRLLEFEDNYFTLYVQLKPGVKVYTRFEVVAE